MQNAMRDKTLCPLCRVNRSMCIVKSNNVSIPLCMACSADIKMSSLEFDLYGKDMFTHDPDTFKDKPASSRIWLNTAFLINKNFSIH